MEGQGDYSKTTQLTQLMLETGATFENCRDVTVFGWTWLGRGRSDIVWKAKNTHTHTDKKCTPSIHSYTVPTHSSGKASPLCSDLYFLFVFIICLFACCPVRRQSIPEGQTSLCLIHKQRYAMGPGPSSHPHLS